MNFLRNLQFSAIGVAMFTVVVVLVEKFHAAMVTGDPARWFWGTLLLLYVALMFASVITWIDREDK